VILGGTVAVGLLAAGAVAAGGFMGGDGDGWGPGWRHHGMGGHGMWGHGGGGPDGPGPGPERAQRIVGHALSYVDATPEQTQKINAIIDQAFKDFGPMRQEMETTRDQALGLFRAATLDRAAVEKLRAERIARMDEVSKKVVNAALDAAETLTPEQRAKIATELDSMRDRRRGPFEK
jgi:Spy/CpxP family protein refolding chaperone